jgi:hypothetical protein
MRNFDRVKRLVRAVSVLSIALAAPVFGDSLKITGPGYGGVGNVMSGVYVNPYDAQFTSSAGQVSNIQVFCDDYYASVTLNQSWNVITTNFDDLAANIANTRWGNPSLTGYVGSAAQALNLYRQAAWLSEKLLAESNKTVQGQISFAIWGLFAPNSLNTLSSTNKTGALNWISAASTASASFTAEQFSKFVLYTPTPLIVGSSPQEFIAIRTPEPGVMTIWVLNVAVLVGAVLFLRRRLVLS